MTKKFAIGIDVGGTAIKYGICSENGEILEQAKVDSPSDSPNEVMLKKISGVIRSAFRSADEKKFAISAIGIGTPGCVDVESGFLKGGTPNFKYWKNVAIVESLKDEFSAPIFVDNDANLMAFGESVFGAGRGKKNIICVTLGTGIGGGIVLNGEIYRGAFYAGAELGHMSICYNGRHCNCGGKGCWERYGSASAMIEDYNAANPGKPVSDTREIFSRLQRGENTARKIVDQTIEYIGVGLANIINIFNPEAIVLGGGLSEAGDDFIQKISQAAFRRANKISAENVQIVAAALGNRVGLLGAAAFALKKVISNHKERKERNESKNF